MRSLIIRLFTLLGSLAPALASAGLPINLSAGWNLVGNSDAASIDVATSLGDSTKITSAWKWNKIAGKWAFYAPSLAPSALTTYAQSMGYDVLSSIASKDGFWVNAATTVVLTNPLAPPPTPGGTSVTLLESDLQQGWNLMADAYSMTPSQLNAALSSSLDAAGKAIVTVWAWDAPSAKWKFYAPSLEAQGATVLADYISNRGYLPFSTFLSAKEGFWLNVGASGRGPGVGGDSGTLTIIKDAQPNDPQDFHFATIGAGLSAFDLDDDGTNANPLSNSITFTNLAAGIPFTVTEDAVSGWTVPSIQCLVAVPGLTTTFTDQLNRTFTVNLEAGANVTCTFINVKTTPTFTAGGPTLQVSTQAMIPTVLQTATAFTSTGSGNSGTATVTAGPTGATNNGIYTLASFANPYPVFPLVGAVATLPSSIVLSSGTALPMTSSSLGGTAGLTLADFGMWAITNAVPPPLPPNSVITYSAYAGGAQPTATMPTISSKTYTGKMTGVVAHMPIGGSDDVSGMVSLTVNYASGTGTISGSLGLMPGITTAAGASTVTPCNWPVSAAQCTYAAYRSWAGLSWPFSDVSISIGTGNVTGSSFSATVTTPDIASATITTMTGNFYGANADEIAGTFTISVPSLGSPGPGMILIGSFGAKQ